MERLDWRTIEEIHGFKNRTGSVSSTADRSWFQSDSVNWPEKWLNRNQTGWIDEPNESVDSLLTVRFIFFFQCQNDVVLILLRTHFHYSLFRRRSRSRPSSTTRQRKISGDCSSSIEKWNYQIITDPDLYAHIWTWNYWDLN